MYTLFERSFNELMQRTGFACASITDNNKFKDIVTLEKEFLRVEQLERGQLVRPIEKKMEQETYLICTDTIFTSTSTTVCTTRITPARCSAAV